MQTIQKHLSAIKAGVAAMLLCLVLGLPALAFAEPETGDDTGDASVQAASIETAANMVTVPASFVRTGSATSTHLSASVSYAASFKKGDSVRFTYNITGNTNPMIYTLYSFEIETPNGWSSLIDTSKNSNTDPEQNFIDEEIYSAGKYRLTFTVNEFTWNDDGTKKLGPFTRFCAEFTIKEQGEFKTISSIVSDVAMQCEEACSATGDTSDYAKALWLNDWIIDNTEYDSAALRCGAEGVFGRGVGTCEGYHEAYTMLLNKVGIATKRVDSKGDDHVWTGVNLDGKWYHVDTTWNDQEQLSSYYPDLRRLYFAIPNDIMKLVHTKWDGNYYVSLTERPTFDATAYEDNYFIRSGEIEKYTQSYIDSTSGAYSVKANTSAKKSSFTLPIANTGWPDSYKNVIYNLVAYQLGQERCWGATTRVAANYANDSLNFTATYNNKPSIASATVTGVTDQTYASKKIEQNPKVVVNGKTLVEGRDYTLSYSNNVNASTKNNPAVMTITGIGDYCESKTVTFTIKQAKLSETTVDVFPTITYNGQAQKPTPTVRAGDGVLSAENYTVSYQNNINAGDRTATIVIKAKGSNCTGEKRVVFTISPKALPKPSVSSSNIAYNGKAQEPVVVKDGAKTLVKGTDYTVKYTNNTNVGTAKAVVTGKGNYKGSQTISFQIRSSSSSSNNTASGGSAAGTNVGSSSTALKPAGNASTITQTAPKSSAVTGAWKKSGGKWWFSYDAKSKASQKKSYPANEWVSIKGKRYHFDSKGYMNTKWYKSGSAWYWLGTDGAMRTGWVKAGSKWYFMENNGIMQTGKRQIAGQVYFLNASNGAMKTGWSEESDGWHYYKSSGAMAKGWTKVKNKWYYLNPSDGLMKTGFYDVNGARYYSNSSGAMLTGWQAISGKWYYFSKSGAMQKSKWISGKYWVDANGVMATNTWIGKYHVNASGKWDRTR